MTAPGGGASGVGGLRLTILQYAGDYREDWLRFGEGGAETYQAQRLSVDYVAGLAGRLASVTTISGVTSETYDEQLSSGVRAIGAGFSDTVDAAALTRMVAESRPDRLLLRAPMAEALDWASGAGVRTLATLADSFQGDGMKARARHWLLARRLNRRHVDWVGNHGRNAAMQLRGIGVRPGKVIPWDWPAARSPADVAAKSGRADPAGAITLFYAGMIAEAKGTDDLVRAVGLLVGDGRLVRLALAGKGEADRVAADVAAAGLGESVSMLGTVANADVFRLMREADFVIVPSRHEYPEGLPLTIYEALCARTPIIASDHPMFVGNLRDGESALIFRAGDAGHLAARIAEAAGDAALYARLSAGAEAAWGRMQLPVTWPMLVDRWLADGDEDRAWLQGHSLASGHYEWRD